MNENSRSKGIQALQEHVSDPEFLASHFNLDSHDQALVAKKYRVRIPQYYLNLIQHPDDPIGKQALPSMEELSEDDLPEDPYLEDDPRYSPVPHLTHRYPDRVLLLVTDVCPMYCRFCMRKRKTQRGASITKETIMQGIDYIRNTPQVREVILSGGDPLMLADHKIESLLEQIHSIPHVDVVRIHTKMPCVEPRRITPELAQRLGKYPPMYLIVHFNHPREITPQAEEALSLLANAGICLGNQSVLLKGVNDDAEVMKELCLKLLKNRVRPYYLHQGDLVHGTNHFRTRVETGLQIVGKLRGQITGLAVPQFVVDAPGGEGSITAG